MANLPTHVTFYFDPICPFSYKTSLWIREVRTVRPIEIDWRFLSLQAINQGTENLKDAHAMSLPAFRTMAKARRERGDEIIDPIYREVGRLRHEEKEDIANLELLSDAIGRVGLDPALVMRALEDESTMTAVQEDHDSGLQKGAFGVASIELDNDNRAFFGPVLSEVPTGERAGEMWDHFTWLISQPEFYEVKRERH